MRMLSRYGLLHIDRLRLGAIENLAVLFNTLFGLMLLSLLVGFAVLFLAAAAVWVIAILMGSVVWALLIVGGGFLLGAWIVYLCRKHLIVDTMVRMFSRMAYDMNRKIEGRESDGLSPDTES